MQFTYTKNSPRGADIFGISNSPLKRRKSRKSVHEIIETSNHIRRSQTANPYTYQGTIPGSDFPEIRETESQAFLSTQRTQKMATEPLAEIKELIESKDEGNLFSLEDGRQTKVEFQKLQVLDWGLAIVTVIVAFLVVVTYDLEFHNNTGDLATVFLWTIFALNFVGIFMTVLRYKQNLRFLKARNLVLQKATLVSTGDIWFLLAEAVVFLIQPYPFSRGIQVHQYDTLGGVDYFYHINDFFSLLLVLRLYIIGRFILNNLMYRSPRSHRIANMYGSESGYIYACRSIMKVNPITGVTLLLCCSIMIFGYMIRVCERPLNRDPTVIIEFDTYWNSMWCVILTMTTVGYGDIYARTMLGRAVSLLVCLWGTCVVSIMVVTLTNILTMSSVEEKSLMITRRLEARKRQKEEAAFVLTNIAKIALLRRKKMNKEKQHEETKEIIKDLKRHLSTFKKTSREIKGLDDSVGAAEEVTRQIRFVGEDIKTLMESQEKLQRTVNDYIMYSQAARYPESLFHVPDSKTPRASREDAIIHKSR